MNISNTKLVGSIFLGALFSTAPSYAMDIELLKKGTKDSFLSLKEKILAPFNMGVNAREIYSGKTWLIKFAQSCKLTTQGAKKWQNQYGDDMIAQIMIAQINDVYSNLTFFLDHPETDVNIQDNKGSTALMKAASNNTQATSLILGHPKTDVNIQDNKGMTALMKAISNNKPKVVSLLLSRPDTDLTLKNSKQETAYDLAKRKKMDKACIQLIQESYPRYSEVNTLLSAPKDDYGPTLTGMPWGLRKKIAEYVNEKELTETLQEQFEKFQARDAIMEQGNFSPDQKRALEKHLKQRLTPYEREALDAYIVQKSIEIAHAVEENRKRKALLSSEELRGAPGKEELD